MAGARRNGLPTEGLRQGEQMRSFASLRMTSDGGIGAGNAQRAEDGPRPPIAARCSGEGHFC